MSMKDGTSPEAASRHNRVKPSVIDTPIKAKRLGIGIVFFLTLVYTSNIWMGSGHIVFSDFDFGLDDTIYMDKILGLFNTQFSSMNFFNLSRLIFITPFYLLSLVFSNIFPHFLLRSIIIAVLLLSGAGMYLFCDKILLKHFGNSASYMHYIGLIVPAVLYAINPWAIFRIQHIFLLPGYACFPWILSYFLDLFRTGHHELEDSFSVMRIPLIKKEFLVNDRRWKDIQASIKMALFIAIGSAAIHYFFYYVLTIITFSLAMMFYNMRQNSDKAGCVKLFIQKNLTLWITVFLFCAYWIIPYLAGTVLTSIEPNNVNVIDTLDMFSRNSSLANIAYLISYWWPMFNFTTHLDVYFWISGGIFLFLIIYIALYRFNKHFYVALFSFASIAMIILGFGVNNTLVDDLNIFIVTKVPIIGHIFRDPNKLVGPLAAFFCILLAFSINRYLFLFSRSGYGKGIQGFFIVLLIVAHFFYVRPFITVFMQSYYTGSKVPSQYSLVNRNFSSEEGKILWIPSMDNMVLSNGISNYSWNSAGPIGNALGHVKTAGDFHQYSSRKNEIFQHENNDGVISYFYSFIQYMLDRTGAQHLGSLLSWAGFNEVGFHQDVFLQGERLKFNYNVLNAQTDMKPHYQDGLFTLYDLEDTQLDVFAPNQAAYLSKDLYSFLYLLDEKDTIGISPQHTALIWSSQKKYAPMDFRESDILIGDSKLDFIMPYVDERYFSFPFDEINTGNPNVGWAKSMVNDSEWYWILNVNNIANPSFSYDFSRGFVYTNVSHKLSMPFSRIPLKAQDQLIYTKDILNDFFTPDNPDIMRLTVFPEVDNGQGVLQGKLMKGYSANNIWQVAKSKYMDVSTLQGGFISIRALVSGVNAGSINFKIHFYDENDDEVGVAYASKPNSLSEFTKTNMVCDTYVPYEAKRMRIDILNIQDTALDTTFWIHDFRIYNLSQYSLENTITIPVGEKSSNDRFRVFMRAFVCDAADGIVVRDDTLNLPVNLKDTRNSFQWIDLGTLTLKDRELTILPKDGLTIINTVVMLPEGEADAIMNDVTARLKGQQLDFSLASSSYAIQADFPVIGMDAFRIFPNTIDGSIIPINKGTMTKSIDILKEDDYCLWLTGNLPGRSILEATMTNQAGEALVLSQAGGGEEVERNFNGSHYAQVMDSNQYFLKEQADISENWRMMKYGFTPVRLKPGRYEVKIQVRSDVENLLQRDSLHLLKPDEIVIPEHMRTMDEDIISIYAVPPQIHEEEADGTKVFVNTPSKSKMWTIYSQNKVKVRKGQMIGLRVDASMSGLVDAHGKLMWLDDNATLFTSSYVPFDEKTQEFYMVCEAPVDGYLQPCYFVRSDALNEGRFSLVKDELYIIDDFAKVEGTILMPRTLAKPEAPGKVVMGSFNHVKAENGRFVIQNEAYNRLFRFTGTRNSKPVVMNFLHNGFIMTKEDEAGFITIMPAFLLLYDFFVLSSVLLILLGLLLLKAREVKRKKASALKPVHKNDL